ncbi:hypothetical protein ONS95_003513 [Cadophora gregata]|uniref:uncharacterized protein n=1 Tax=Cadophora gregata TaxID=51156 RepID=UPI0026DBDA27|nr:uncharacterized protein ONS95_003513 [Cadophora gregata]KAK0106788.1 hypothetical protein ONS95_003513 [Cadophora gregata]
MPYAFQNVIRKQYTPVPVPHGFIPSTGTPKPHILWVGCSDSLILETETLGVLPDEIFVHRNLGNILSNGDLSSESAVDWCVGLLKVDHIVICGHYDCALIDKGDGSELGGWHKNVTKLHHMNEDHLERVKSRLDDYCRHRRLEEVYVLAEVGWLKRQEIVKKAIEERGLQIHAFVYDKAKNACVRLVEEQEEN